MERTRNELFSFDADFLNTYTFLLNKYSFDFSSTSMKELISDLLVSLGCLAVAIAHTDTFNNIEIDYINPDFHRKELCTYIRCQTVMERITELISIEYYGGVSLFIDESINPKVKYPMEVDIILLPPTLGTTLSGKMNRFVILLDASKLIPIVNHKSERDLQRNSLAQFIFGWWTKFFSPKYWFDPNSLQSTRDNENQLTFPNWLYSASIVEILQVCKISAEFTRRHYTFPNVYFIGENDENHFDWGKWNPRDLYYCNNNQIQKLQSYSKLVAYWSRWLDVHRQLEKVRTSNNNNDGNGSISDWIGYQRTHLDEIDCNLGLLSKLLYNSFKIGEIGLLPAVISQKKGEIVITRETLFCYCFSQWISNDLPKSLRAQIKSSIYSDVEFGRILHAISTLVHYIYGNHVMTDDVIHRMIQLLSLYGHNYLSIPNRLDLRTHLLHMARGEPALHALKPYYRDHFFHAIEVCFLGHLLLDSFYNENTTLWQLIAEKLNLCDDKNKVVQLWYISSLLHDIGYAMDIIKNSKDYLGFFVNSSAINNLGNNINKAISDLAKEEELRLLFPDFIDTKDIEQDHGVVGALHLQSLLHCIQDDDNQLALTDFSSAVSAIGYHNLREQNKKISFSTQPLAFLLAICDQLQEWKRPRLNYSTSPNWFISTLSSPQSDTRDIDGAFERMKINLVTEKIPGKGNITRIQQNGNEVPCLLFEMEFNEKINRNSNLFQLWIDATLNFQRLQFDDFPFEICVIFISPYFTTHNGVRMSQLHRLRDAAHETHMTFLADWFPIGISKNKDTPDKATTDFNHPITYWVENNKEHLCINLNTLAQKPLISRNMDSFWERIREWKNFNDDRDFPGDYASSKPK